jgi:hypothetical protein
VSKHHVEITSSDTFFYLDNGDPGSTRGRTWADVASCTGGYHPVGRGLTIRVRAGSGGSDVTKLLIGLFELKFDRLNTNLTV